MTYTNICNFDDGGHAEVCHNEDDCLIVATGNPNDMFDMAFSKHEAIQLARAILKHYGADK